MTAETLRLVRTPAQQPGESPLGFVLRVSEANGYETPRYVFSLAGIPRREMFTLWLNTSRLATVLGCKSDELQGYQTLESSGASRIALCGQPLAPEEIGVWRPRLCPQCVSECGFLPAWADLAFVDACPVHRRELLTHCPSCASALSWFRPGLLTCRCDADLTGARGREVTDEHTLLVHYLVSKATGAVVEPALGGPGSQLASMDLTRMLTLCRSLALLHAAATRGGADASPAQRAARMLVQWPNNLHAALRAVVSSAAEGSAAGRMRQQLEGVYRTWLKNVSAAADIAFLREALAGFEDGQDAGAVAELAIEGTQGLPSDSTRAAGKRRAPRVAASSRRSPRCSEPGHRSYGARDAARRLGMPVSVLKFLRQDGHFAVRHQASRAAAFHEADIEAFEAKLAALRPGQGCREAAGRSLGWVFAQKLKFSAGKGELLAAVLDGRIAVVGSEGSALVDLLLHAAQVDAFIARARSQAFGGAMTPSEVAQLLDCDPLAVPGLIAAGHLRGHLCAAGHRVEADSVEEFGRRYRSVAALARERGTSSRYLLRTAQGTGLAFLSVPRRHSTSVQSFLRVEDVEGLNGPP